MLKSNCRLLSLLALGSAFSGVRADDHWSMWTTNPTVNLNNWPSTIHAVYAGPNVEDEGDVVKVLFAAEMVSPTAANSGEESHYDDHTGSISAGIDVHGYIQDPSVDPYSVELQVRKYWNYNVFSAITPENGVSGGYGFAMAALSYSPPDTMFATFIEGELDATPNLDQVTSNGYVLQSTTYVTVYPGEVADGVYVFNWHYSTPTMSFATHAECSDGEGAWTDVVGSAGGAERVVVDIVGN